MKRATWIVAIVAVLGLGGRAAVADDLSFTAGIDVAANCNDVWTNLTEFPRLQKLRRLRPE